ETSQFRTYTKRNFYNGDEQPTNMELLTNANRSERLNKSIQSGIDYTVSSKTTLGLLVSLSDGNNSDRIDFRLDNIKTDDPLKPDHSTRFRQEQSRMNQSASAHFLHKLNGSGKEWSGEFNYLKFRSEQEQEMTDFNLQVPARMKIWT